MWAIFLLEMPLSKRLWAVRSRRVVWIPAILLLLAPVSARAADADDAKTHYQKATAHFAIGEYREAAGEYEEAFKLKQDPAILFNAAQSFRLAGDNQKALLLYNNIIKLYPGTQYAKDSKERIEKLAQTGTSPPAAMPPAPTTPPPAASPPVAPIAPAPVTAAAPPPALAPETTAPGASPLVVSSSPSPTEDASDLQPLVVLGDHRAVAVERWSPSSRSRRRAGPPPLEQSPHCQAGTER